MTINAPPLASQISTRKETVIWPRPWGNWMTQVFLALFGWTRTYTGVLTYDFGSIAAQSQATTTATITGVRSGDALIVRPATAVNGVILDGSVTADDVVTIRAVNYSIGAVDPGSQNYRIIVFQQ